MSYYLRVDLDSHLSFHAAQGNRLVASFPLLATIVVVFLCLSYKSAECQALSASQPGAEAQKAHLLLTALANLEPHTQNTISHSGVITGEFQVDAEPAGQTIALTWKYLCYADHCDYSNSTLIRDKRTVTISKGTYLTYSDGSLIRKLHKPDSFVPLYVAPWEILRQDLSTNNFHMGARSDKQGTEIDPTCVHLITDDTSRRSGNTHDWCFDAATGLPTELDFNMPSVPLQGWNRPPTPILVKTRVLYTNYALIGSHVVPRKIEYYQNGTKIGVITVTAAETDITVILDDITQRAGN